MNFTTNNKTYINPNGEYDNNTHAETNNLAYELNIT